MRELGCICDVYWCTWGVDSAITRLIEQLAQGLERIQDSDTCRGSDRDLAILGYGQAVGLVQLPIRGLEEIDGIRPILQ